MPGGEQVAMKIDDDALHLGARHRAMKVEGSAIVVGKFRRRFGDGGHVADDDRSQVGQGATFLAASAVLGGDYARLRTDCRLVGRGATGDLLSAYFGEGDQTLETFAERVRFAGQIASGSLAKFFLDKALVHDFPRRVRRAAYIACLARARYAATHEIQNDGSAPIVAAAAAQAS